MYVVRLQQAGIVQVGQLAFQLVDEQLVAAGPIQAVLFDAVVLLDVSANVDDKARHIRMIRHVQLQHIQPCREQRILGLLI